MSGDDWPDDSRDDADSRRDDQDAWYDQPGDEPAPPPKQGMSTAAKILIVILCLTGGFFLLCCGGIIYIGSQMNFEVIEDPVVAAERLTEIADIDVPDSFEAEGSASFDIFFMSMQMVAFQPTNGQGVLIIGQVNLNIEAGPEAEEDMRRSIREQGGQKRLNIDEESVETREFEIRGNTAEFEFAKAENDDGEVYRQVVGSFEGKQGTAILVLQVEEEHYDEDAVVKMLESIK